MRTGRYLNDEHRDLVAAVLVARGKVARIQRTRSMVKGALAKGRARQEALDDIDAQIDKANLAVKYARAVYKSFVDRMHDDLVQHWMSQDLFDGEEDD